MSPSELGKFKRMESQPTPTLQYSCQPDNMVQQYGVPGGQVTIYGGSSTPHFRVVNSQKKSISPKDQPNILSKVNPFNSTLISALKWS